MSSWTRERKISDIQLFFALNKGVLKVILPMSSCLRKCLESVPSTVPLHILLTGLKQLAEVIHSQPKKEEEKKGINNEIRIYTSRRGVFKRFLMSKAQTDPIDA